MSRSQSPKTDRPIIAVDLGGTQLRVATIDQAGRIVSATRAPTQAEEGPEQVVRRIGDAIAQAIAALGDGHPCGIAVGVPGPVDPWRGVVLRAPNLPDWENVPLADLLRERFDLPVVIGNDANLAALGEARYGAGRGHRHLVYLTVSTGVGSGIVVDGRLLVGSAGLASEAGHITIELAGPVCGCGNRGCLEALAAGPAIARRAEELLAAGATSSLATHRGSISAADVARAADEGDALAREVLSQAAMALGAGIASLVHLFNPTVVILGGGVSRSGPLWWDTVRASVRQRAMAPFLSGLEIVPAGLGDDVGLLGAAAALLDAEAGA